MRREDVEVLEQVGFRFKPDQRQRKSKDHRDNKHSWVEEMPLDLDIRDDSWYKGSMENDTQPDSSETKPNSQEKTMNANTNTKTLADLKAAVATAREVLAAADKVAGEAFGELRAAQKEERAARGFMGRVGGVFEASGQTLLDYPGVTVAVVTAAVVVGGCYAASQYTDFGQDFFGSSMADSSSDLSM